MNCPFRNFEDCPEHNKKNGCSFWISYSTNNSHVEAQVDGCAISLTPLLLLEQANNLGVVANEVNKVGAEVSAGRVEHIKEASALRKQFISLAQGSHALVCPDHTTLKLPTA